jgi:glycosyltransferase involved in cell wall biosynthesis
MDVDRLYHTLNPNNYASVRFRVPSRMKNFENNLRLVDVVTFPDRVVEDYYSRLTSGVIKTKILPNMLSPHIYTGINFNKELPKKPRKVVLIVADQDDFDDINSFRTGVDDLCVKIPEADVVVIGNCVNFEEKNPLRFVKVNYVRYKDMAEYYRKLYEINADVCIIPTKKLEFYRPYYKLLELASFGIPMVAMNEYPFNHLLGKETILLAGQKRTLIDKVKLLLTDADEHSRIKRAAQEFVLGNYIFSNAKMFRAYEELFSV